MSENNVTYPYIIRVNRIIIMNPFGDIMTIYVIIRKSDHLYINYHQIDYRLVRHTITSISVHGSEWVVIMIRLAGDAPQLY